ncbi:VOC family protein [Acidimicrobiaceae bacterium AH-315-P05]|nr:VOC family protein [Acidimicrobiaceae bacterium AH-315-P05]
MSRFQLSLNVKDVDAAVEFYTKLFGVGPAKHRDGYANFAIVDPPLKLVVIEEGDPGTINHVGIEYDSGEAVVAETERVAALGIPVVVDDAHTCCFATQEKAWARDADGVPWELYTVVADTEDFGANPHDVAPLDKLLPPVSVDELQAALDDPNVVVIDAQGNGGYDTAHLEGAVDFSLDDVVGQAPQNIDAKDQRVVVYCTDADCLGAEFVGTQLVEAGYSNVGRFPGGVDAWATSGRPTESSKAGAVGS